MVAIQLSTKGVIFNNAFMKPEILEQLEIYSYEKQFNIKLIMPLFSKSSLAKQTFIN